MKLISRMYLLPKAREYGVVTTLLHTPEVGGAEDKYSEEHICFLIAYIYIYIYICVPVPVAARSKP